MDEYNRTLLQHSYEAVARDLPNGQIPDTDAVCSEMTYRWLGHRDTLIDIWTHQTLVNVPHDRLGRLTQKVWRYAVDTGFCWEQPEETSPEWTACALACLRWWHMECNGRAPVPALGKDEVDAWLKEYAYPVHRVEAQLSLFAGVS